MNDQPSPTSGSASGTDPVRANFRTEDEHRSHSKRERPIEVVVLLDYIAGTLGMITAGIYLTLKVLNERIFPGHPQNFVFRLMIETHRFARVVGLSGIPGLSEDRALWYFTNRSLVDSFLVALALMHLAASAACLGFGYAVARRRPWARLTQAILATLALVLIVAYAVAYTVPVAPRAGLVAIAGAAIVPAWVAYVLMSPTGASAFSVGDQDVTDRALPPRSRIPFLVRFMLGGILGLFVVGCLPAFFWVSVPTVILLRRFTLCLTRAVTTVSGNQVMSVTSGRSRLITGPLLSERERVASKGKDLQIIPRRLGNGRTQRPRKRLKETDHQGPLRHNPGVGIMEVMPHSA